MFNLYHGPWQLPPWQFHDSNGKWHLYGVQWFERNSEHICLETDIFGSSQDCGQ